MSPTLSEISTELYAIYGVHMFLSALTLGFVVNLFMWHGKLRETVYDLEESVTKFQNLTEQLEARSRRTFQNPLADLV